VKILLDSHIFVWMHQEPENLSKQALKLLEDVSNTLYLSHASLWELQAKISAGRLAFEGGLIARASAEQKQNGLQLLPVNLVHIEFLSKLPFYKDHSDPFDRMLIAQAAVEGLTLMSADHKIQQFNYGIPVVWE
jgi:PIN domain nuclease of toxin-antitoxin system